MPPDLNDPAPFRCEVHTRREVVRVCPVGELDIATVPLVEAHLTEFAAGGFRQLTLDLRAVCFLDSTGLRLILRWDARSRADNFTFSLVAGPPRVQRLFDLTRLTGRLSFVEASPAGDRAESHKRAGPDAAA